MRQRKIIIAAGFVVAALAVIVGLLVTDRMVGGFDRFRYQSGHRLHARFKNVQNLKAGDPVTMAGIEIGRVEDIMHDAITARVRVTMKLRQNVIVKTDSTATIKLVSPQGRNFVAIDFGSPPAPTLEDNQHLLTVEESPGP